MSMDTLDGDDSLTGLSEEERLGYQYLDGITELRSKVTHLQEALLEQGPGLEASTIEMNGQSYEAVVTTATSSIDITLVRRSGEVPSFPAYAHFLITSSGMLRVSLDGLNVTPPQQPLQPYATPGPEGIQPNLQVRIWLDPFIESLSQAVAV